MLLTLRSKILSGYVALAVLMAALGAYMVVSFQDFTGISTRAYELISNAERANLAIHESLVRINDATVRSFAKDTLIASTALLQEPGRINSEINSAEKIISSIPVELAPSLSASFTRLEVLWHQYQAQLPEFTNRLQPDPAEARKFYEGVLLPTYLNLTQQSRDVSVNITALYAKTRDLTEVESRDAARTVVFVTLGAILIGLLVGFAIVRATTKPLRTLSDSLKRIQDGDLTVHLDVSGADELADVSFEFNRMAERLDRYEKMNIDRLMEEKSKSESVILALDEPLFLFDANGFVLVTNKSAERLVAMPESTIIGSKLSELFSDPVSLSVIREAIAGQHHASQKPPMIEVFVDDSTHYFRVSSTTIVAKTTAESRMPIGTLLHFTDVTHFEELDRMKDDFLAKVSHEFRTPLTSIKMALDILAKSKIGALTDDQRELVLTSKMDTERLSKLIRDLLTITKLRQAQASPREQLNAAEVISTILRSLEAQAKASGITLSKELAPDVNIEFNRGQLESLVQNLVGNAVAHTPRGGSVVALLRRDAENAWSIIVSDTGVGIPEAELERIFERFVQLKPKDVATPGSIGLGLSIVKDIVEANNGKITVTSNIGKGTTFIASFPLIYESIG